MPLITEPSICIPRTLHNVSWRDVKNTFETLFGKGTVERVDIVTDKRSDSPFCRIFVHMRYWAVNTPEVAAVRNKLLAGETVQVVYDNPWFWKCAASRATRPERAAARTAPFIKFDDQSSDGAAPARVSGAASNGAVAAMGRAQRADKEFEHLFHEERRANTTEEQGATKEQGGTEEQGGIEFESTDEQ